MSHVENNLDIYSVFGNANTQRQENEIASIIKKRNASGWELISTSTVIVDTKKFVLKSLFILGKEIVINIVDI